MARQCSTLLLRVAQMTFMVRRSGFTTTTRLTLVAISIRTVDSADNQENLDLGPRSGPLESKIRLGSQSVVRFTCRGSEKVAKPRLAAKTERSSSSRFNVGGIDSL